MERKGIEGVEEARDLPRVSEARGQVAASEGANGKSGGEATWLEAGAEDPAFFIKPSDED